ncbi:hypothetical protein [Deinococcus ruber]|uniref:hypothetical protein n=1 Tax=Deinococcus ruber TaxID=1848197 RepID=UPI001666D9F5|nr:hypothetical protein [Deinococcus ruber]
MFSRSFKKSAASLLCASLLGVAAAQSAPAPPDPAQPSPVQPQPTFTARLLELIPSDYFGRFGSTTAFADSSSGYGIRGLPLPLKADARFTFISHPNYLEYAASLREGDTSYVAGRLQNDDGGATQGVGHLEVTHNPYTGLQYGALLQDQGRSSRFTVGYAWAGGPVHALAEAGYAVQGATNAAYLHFEESAGAQLVNNPAFSVSVAGTVRSYVFTDTTQLSTDLSASFTVRPTDFSSVTVSQLERFAVGSNPIPDLNLARYDRSNIDVLVAPKLAFGPLSWRDVQYHYQRSWQASTDDVNSLSATLRADLAAPVVLDLTPHRDWVANEYGVRADLFYRSAAFPVLFGPSLDYLWTGVGSRWVFSVKAGVK